MIFSMKKRILSAFLSLTMVGTMAASVPFSASAASSMGVSYQIFEQKWSKTVKNNATAGVINKKVFAQSMKVDLTGNVQLGASINYQVYQNKKWVKASDGDNAGVTGKKLAVEAIKVSLDSTEGYSVNYQVYENKKWYKASDGKVAGIINKKYKVEAVKISLKKTAKFIDSVTTEIKDTDVTIGTTADSIIANLPKTVDVALDDGSTKTATVDWSAGSYDAATAGTYSFVGTLTVSGAKNPDGICASATVNVTGSAVATATPVNATIGVGGTTTFTFADKDGKAVTPKNVTYKLEDSTLGVIDASGNFAATKAGKEVVDITADGVALTATVTIYSSTVAGVKISAPANVVANGASYTAVTVSAVDANGNVVSNFNGTFTPTATYGLYSDTNGTAISGTVSFVNGTATVYVKSGTVAGTNITLSVNAISAISTGYTAQTATIPQVAQVATTIKVTANTANFPVNAAYSGAANDFSVQVNDQTGNIMLAGTYTLSAALSGGNATFDGTNATKTIILYAGNETANVLVKVPQGSAGAVALTVSGTSLTTGTASINAVITKVASKLVLTDSTATFVSGDTTTGTTFKVDQYDANGNYIGANADTLTATIKDASGNDVSAKFAVTATAKSSVIVKDAGTTAAGTYTLSVADATLNYTATSTFTVTAGAPSKVVATMTPVIVATGATATATITLQVEDAAGDAVAATSGDVSALTVAANAAKVTASGANKGTAPTFASTAPTFDSTGKATTTVTFQNYEGDTWDFTGKLLDSKSAVVSTSTVTGVTITSHPVATLSFTMADKISTGSTTNVVAGDALYLSALTLKDSSGNAVTTPDTFNVVVNHASGLSGLTGGTANTTADTYTISGATASAIATDFASAKGAKAGTVSVTITDAITNATASASINIDADQGMANGYSVAVSQLANNASLTKTTASTAIIVQLVDAGGNVITSTKNVTVKVNTAAGFGLQDANHVDKTSTGLTIAAGTTSISGFLTVGTAATNVTLTFSSVDDASTPVSGTDLTFTGITIA